MKVVQLHLWIMDKKHRYREPEVLNKHNEPVPGKRIVIEPSGPSILQMKMDVAREIRKWVGKIEYYYVVAVVEKADGTPGYRTIVPKTLVA
jgi:hypothetical protein